MTPENHTLFDWNTLDEYSDLKRLEMVYTSLPAAGLLNVLCQMRSGDGRNDHAIVKHLPGGTCEGLKAGNMHGQHRWQILILAKASPHAYSD